MTKTSHDLLKEIVPKLSNVIADFVEEHKIENDFRFVMNTLTNLVCGLIKNIDDNEIDEMKKTMELFKLSMDEWLGNFSSTQKNLSH